MRNISNVANVKVLPVPMLPITKKWESNAEHFSYKQSYPIPQNENLVRNILIGEEGREKLMRPNLCASMRSMCFYALKQKFQIYSIP